MPRSKPTPTLAQSCPVCEKRYDIEPCECDNLLVSVVIHKNFDPDMAIKKLDAAWRDAACRWWYRLCEQNRGRCAMTPTTPDAKTKKEKR